MRIFGRKKNRGREEDPDSLPQPQPEEYEHGEEIGVDPPVEPAEEHHDIGGEG